MLPGTGNSLPHKAAGSSSRHWAPCPPYRAIPELNHVSFLPGFNVSAKTGLKGEHFALIEAVVTQAA